MKKSTKSRLKQAFELNEEETFQDMIRGMVKSALLGVIEEEIEGLCGPRYGRSEERPFYRSGGVSASVYLNGRYETVRRPRVRERLMDGGSREHGLETWKAAKDPAAWEDAVMRAVLGGVSTRQMEGVYPDDLASHSHSSVSRLWNERAGAFVQELQHSDLSGFDLLVLMVDGVVLGKDLVAVVALGFDVDGHKRVLGYRLGSSENAEVCKDLLVALVQRGLRMPKERRLLAVLDGSQALEKALLEVFPGTLVQRCLVHKERNLRGYLSRKSWGELARLFTRLRRSQGAAAAEEAAQDIAAFLKGQNAQAQASWEEAGDTLLTLLRLGVNNHLNVALLSTNAIENIFRNLRSHLGRVCRYRDKPDQEGVTQADKWLASGLLLAEEGFRRLNHYEHLKELAKALKRAA